LNGIFLEGKMTNQDVGACQQESQNQSHHRRQQQARTAMQGECKVGDETYFVNILGLCVVIGDDDAIKV
jgi:hypothetical protein